MRFVGKCVDIENCYSCPWNRAKKGEYSSCKKHDYFINVLVAVGLWKPGEIRTLVTVWDIE